MAERGWWRLPLLVVAMLALAGGVLGGLARLGWSLPALPGSMVVLHGPLLVAGFFGTLIGLERALALGGRWPFAAPLLSGLGGLALLLGLPWPAGPLLISLGSLALVAVNGAIIRRQAADFTVTMGLGAAAWLAGNLLWLSGRAVPQSALWWAGFLVLTIAGERLDLSRLRRRPAWARAAFGASAGLLLAGLALAFAAADAGTRLAGSGLAALALWLLAFDIAGRTVRQRGLPRYIAGCLLAGYAWLAVSGGLALALGAVSAGAGYDALLHSLFVGFVFSMIFGHAPIIAPVVTRRSVAFRPAFYAPLALLHLALLLRVAGDLAGAPPWRLWGGLLNAVALLLFALLLISAIGAPVGLATAAPPVAGRAGGAPPAR